jgi:uncharacterized protein YndB with AHSA1/START domain
VTLPPIRHRVYVAREHEAVYRALTDPAELDTWFTTRSRIDLRPGGTIEFEWRAFGVDHVDVRDGGPILDVVPNRRLAFQWQPASHPTTATISLEPKGPGTVVTLVEDGYEDTPHDLSAYVEVAVGWGEALTLLKFYLEHRITYGQVPA